MITTCHSHRFSKKCRFGVFQLAVFVLSNWYCDNIPFSLISKEIAIWWPHFDLSALVSNYVIIPGALRPFLLTKSLKLIS